MTKREAKLGTRVRVGEGAGLDSGKVGVVVKPRLDHRGFPKDVPGVYKPFDPKKEAYILCDDQTYTAMYFNYLTRV